MLLHSGGSVRGVSWALWPPRPHPPPAPMLKASFQPIASVNCQGVNWKREAQKCGSVFTTLPWSNQSPEKPEVRKRRKYICPQRGTLRNYHNFFLFCSVFSLRLGFIKRPCVSEIISFTSFPEQTLSLGCQITDFYPPNISVTWLKLRDRDQDDGEEEVIGGGEIWGPVETHPRLYRTTATLTERATNLGKKERRGGVTCRVEHCSLMEPIERHWKSVDLGTKLLAVNNGIYSHYLWHIHITLF